MSEFVETNALLAAMGDDTEEMERLVGTLLWGEASALASAAHALGHAALRHAELLDGRRDRLPARIEP